MESENRTLHVRVNSRETGADDWRRHCGCIKTSDKLKEILKSFPAPPPPTPAHVTPPQTAPKTAFENRCISTYCTHTHQPIAAFPYVVNTFVPKQSKDFREQAQTGTSGKSWHIIAELVQLVQLSVTATALALYYLIYCYMQLVYYTLRSALYFHNADGPMKITIGVVTVTSLVVGFNLLLRMERLIGIL
ncbi:uncharacterized protein ACR2FA_004362 [Aphomia sociella]